MKSFWLFLYNISVMPVLFTGLHLASYFNRKIKIGVLGRKDLYENLKTKIDGLDNTKPLVWVHSASLGEFEQAKPIIEKFKKSNSVNVIVTFFSPSGYENSKRYPFADVISYAPFDSPSKVRRFFEIVKPNVGILMRYDIWPNTVAHAQAKGIPLFLIDATLRETSIRRKILFRAFHSWLFSCFSGILTVSENDRKAFECFSLNIGILQSVGDTRFDRVNEKSIEARTRNLLRPDIIKDKNVFVAGSTWEEDEEILFPVLKKMLHYDKSMIAFVVPHEPVIEHIEKIEQEFAGKIATIRFSFLNEYNGQQIVIIDSIGILLSLYYYAQVAFVGGSFKSSIHNVLEAAVYGIPVLYGPKIHTSIEAQKLAQIGAGKIITTRNETYKTLRKLFTNSAERERLGQVAKEYILENVGAADKIVEILREYFKRR